MDAAPGAPPAEMRAFLLSAVMGALVHAHRLLPLHASGVHTAGGCVLLAGPSGSGKSTLTARLMNAGYPLWGDDLTAVTVAPDGTPMAYSGTTVLRLPPDAVYPTHHPLRPPEAPSPLDALPVRRIYLLGKRSQGAVALRILRGAERMRGVLQHTSRLHLAAPVGRRSAHFPIASAVAERVELFELDHPYQWSGMETLMATLMAHMTDAGLTPADGASW